MAIPEYEFLFELLGERHNPRGPDDRLFRVNELPQGSVAAVLNAIRSLGSPANSVWVPVWKFGTEEEKIRADQEIDRILNDQKSTGLIIYSRDMVTFRGCWSDQRINGHDKDWFAILGIP
jgi:hypothetical protein